MSIQNWSPLYTYVSCLECAECVDSFSNKVHGLVLRTYTKAFGYRMASIYPYMHEGIVGLRDPKDPAHVQSWSHGEMPTLAIAFFAQKLQDGGESIDEILNSMSAVGDAWQDGDLESVIPYLRGAKSLNVPPGIRAILKMDQ